MRRAENGMGGGGGGGEECLEKNCLFSTARALSLLLSRIEMPFAFWTDRRTDRGPRNCVGASSRRSLAPISSSSWQDRDRVTRNWQGARARRARPSVRPSVRGYQVSMSFRPALRQGFAPALLRDRCQATRCNHRQSRQLPRPLRSALHAFLRGSPRLRSPCA